jgi:hypothetical protein
MAESIGDLSGRRRGTILPGFELSYGNGGDRPAKAIGKQRGADAWPRWQPSRPPRSDLRAEIRSVAAIAVTGFGP